MGMIRLARFTARYPSIHSPNTTPAVRKQKRMLETTCPSLLASETAWISMVALYDVHKLC